MPNASGPLSASPESLTITRRNPGTITSFLWGRGHLARTFFLKMRAGRPRSREERRSCLAGGRRDLSSKIRARTIDAFSERIVHKTRDLDGTADLAFGILQRLGD